MTVNQAKSASYFWFPSKTTSVLVYETMARWGSENTRMEFHSHPDGTATIHLHRLNPTSGADITKDTDCDCCVILNESHLCPPDCP